MKLTEMPTVCWIQVGSDGARCLATAYGESRVFGGAVCPEHGGPTEEEWRATRPLRVDPAKKPRR